MLADRRSKIKYNLVPRGKALYEDKNRFGTKMLEKMGWTEGKGLGSKEDGNKDFIRIRCKNDSKGLGFEDRDNQWTQHEEHFNGFLKTLNGDFSMEKSNNHDMNLDNNEDNLSRVGFGFNAGNSCIETKEKDLNIKNVISGESLEEKSKKSRARVHYKKFTRGKDITQYSEKDLANIFGKKTLNDNKNDVINKTITIVDNNLSPEEFPELQNPYGVVVKKSNKSLNDYFSEKMHKIKSKISDSNYETNEKSIESTMDMNQPVENVKKSKKKKKSKHVDDELTTNYSDELKQSSEKSKRKKKLKLAASEEIQSEVTSNQCDLIEMPSEISEDISFKNDKNMKSFKDNENESKITSEDLSSTIDNNKCDSIAITSEIHKDSSSKENNKRKNSKHKRSSDETIVIGNEEKVSKIDENNCDRNSDCNNKEAFVYRTTEYFCELLSYVNYDGFVGSNLKDIIGYGFNENCKIEITDKKFNGHQRNLTIKESEIFNKPVEVVKEKSIIIENQNETVMTSEKLDEINKDTEIQDKKNKKKRNKKFMKKKRSKKFSKI